MRFERVQWTLVVTGMVTAMVIPGVVAQSTTTKYETWENPDQTTGHSTNDPKVQVLLDELTALVDEADRARAADPRFIDDLRELIRSYDWPWRVKILDEDFSDGRVANTPVWSIVTGEFRAEYGVGLRSVIETRSTTEKESTDNEQDLAAQLLNQLLKQATQSQDSQSQKSPDSALIHVATPISNAFAVRSTLSSKPPGGRFEIEIYQLKPRGSGYRLSYNPGTRPSLELLRVGNRGTKVIDAYHQTITLKDDSPHHLQWTRDTQGEMVVSFDGTR